MAANEPKKVDSRPGWCVVHPRVPKKNPVGDLPGGSEGWEAARPYLRDIDAAVLVYDVTRVCHPHHQPSHGARKFHSPPSEIFLKFRGPGVSGWVQAEPPPP